MLSLSNNSALDSRTDPYERAVACLVAIDFLQQRLVGAIGMTGEQRQAMAVARRIYERRAQAAGAGQATGGLGAAIEKARGESDDPGQQARTGVACLRQLA